MPEQLKVPLAGPSRSTSRSTNMNQNLKKSGEWTGESRSDPKRPSTISTKSPKSSSNTASSLKAKHFSSFPITTPFIPHRICPRESIMDIRRKEKSIANDITLINAVKANYRFIYRINDGVGTVNTILQKVCEERGWREFQEIMPGAGNISSYEKAMRSATGWNLWWSYSIYQFSPYKYLRHWQFTNHNPKGFQFCNKLYLTMYLRKMKTIHGSIFDFYPLSFIVPEDYLRLALEHTKRATESDSITSFNNLLNPCDIPPADQKKPPETPSVSVIISKRSRTPVWAKNPPILPSPSEIRHCPVWISKPVAQSQGKGIFLTTDPTNIATDKKSVVQEYICRPLLIAGYKWDVRIYVCVAAIDPLVIYIYHEGLCRFCTEKYKTKDLNQTYSHLTNASINKLSPAYEEDKEMIGQGCKWPLRRLRQYFQDHGISDWLLWQRIMSMVVLTVIGDSLRLGYSASNRNCFDLFGFDVLVDEDLKPWLLECNYSPGLGGDCETDEIVKRPMLHELFDLLGFPDRTSYMKTPGSAGGDKKVSDGSNLQSESRLKSFSTGAIDLEFISKDHLTRHYFDLLMDKMKRVNQELQLGKMNYKWNPSQPFSPQARLMDAKTIYSQNLVVQYLKNQSQGKISNKAREQLISLAAKKLKHKLTSGGTKTQADQQNNKEKRNKSCSSANTPRVDTATQYNFEDLSEPVAESQLDDASTSSSKKSSPSNTSISKPRPKSAPGSATSSSSSTISSTVLFGTLKKEFPHPDSEAFQKLKHYFDAGVDYPLDRKTGKFRECPALLTVKKDWFNPEKQKGGWIRVYPFDARTTKSPYKSSLTDIRQAVRSVESYLKTAEQVFLLNANESDEFYRRKIKNICRRDTEVWVPPLTSWTDNQSYLSPPIDMSESNLDCTLITVDASCTEE